MLSTVLPLMARNRLATSASTVCQVITGQRALA